MGIWLDKDGVDELIKERKKRLKDKKKNKKDKDSDTVTCRDRALIGLFNQVGVNLLITHEEDGADIIFGKLKSIILKLRFFKINKSIIIYSLEPMVPEKTSSRNSITKWMEELEEKIEKTIIRGKQSYDDKLKELTKGG